MAMQIGRPMTRSTRDGRLRRPPAPPLTDEGVLGSWSPRDYQASASGDLPAGRLAVSTAPSTLSGMGTRISGRGWVWRVDEAPHEVKALLSDGEPHVLVPHTVYEGGHEGRAGGAGGSRACVAEEQSPGETAPSWTPGTRAHAARWWAITARATTTQIPKHHRTACRWVQR
jgi:hypothetical protein